MSSKLATLITKLALLYCVLAPVATAFGTPALGYPANAPASTMANQAIKARIALVIGNSNYAQKPLLSPLKDAQAIAEQLGKLGFYVIVQENTSAQALQQALQNYSELLQATNGIGLFYYAGHGIQVNGTNYLIPVDTDLRQAQDVLQHSLSLNQVLEQLGQADNATNIVIIDACRDNPFSEHSGLAPLSYANTPGNTLIAFATAPGNVAIDGDDNGLFTQHLLAHIDTPNLPIEQLFKQVRQGVINDSQGLQIPWEHSSLTGDFSFHPNNLTTIAETSTKAVAKASAGTQNTLLAMATGTPLLKVDPDSLQLGPALVRSSANPNTTIADEIDRYMNTARIYLQDNDTLQATLYLEKAFALSHKASPEQIKILSILYNLALAKQSY